jgi:DNA-binding IclR family transcriptional regulator
MDDLTDVGCEGEILDCATNAPAPLPLEVLTRQTGMTKPTVRHIANDPTERGTLEYADAVYVAGKRLINHGLRSAHRCGSSLLAQTCAQQHEDWFCLPM